MPLSGRAAVNPDHIVCRHRNVVFKLQPLGLSDLINIHCVTHTPGRIARPKAVIKLGIGRGRVNTFNGERPIKNKR